MSPHLPGSYGPLSRYGCLLLHRRVHAGVAACGGHLGRLLRLLAGPRANSQPHRRWHASQCSFYLAVELIVGTLGLPVLRRERRTGRV